MGTTWSVRLDNPRMIGLEALREVVDAALERVLAQMSHWRSDSDLGRFNRSPAGSVHALAPAFASVLACALKWARASDGALDPTVGPLVALWGFGPDAKPDGHSPEPAAVREALQSCGWKKVVFDPASRTLQQPGNLTLDFSGIAKGFAVDHVVEALQAADLTDMLIEVGGELRGVGHRPGGTPWTVQVAAPDDSVGVSQPIALTDLAIATSGDRWHRHEHAGRAWSHTIDPRTGQPTGQALASVTVLHPECMQADALATVLTVLGPVQGRAFADTHAIAALFFERGPHGLRATASRGWAARVPA